MVIESVATPLHMYTLSQTCKRLNNILTKDRIRARIIVEIKRNLRIIFGDDSEELIRTLEASNGVIIGSFITQAMLGELWPDDVIEIYITRSHDGDYVLKTIEKHQVHQSKNVSGILTHYNRYYRVNKYNVVVRSCSSENFSQNVRKYLLFDNCHARNNIYDVASNELLIDTMHEIFMKQTNLSVNESHCYFEYFYRKGFTFYRSREDKQILSDEELLNCIYSVADIQKNFNEQVAKIDTTMMIQNNLVCFRGIICPPFRIINTDIPDSTSPLYIRTCDDPDCHATMLGVDPNHYHCENNQWDDDSYLLVWNNTFYDNQICYDKKLTFDYTFIA